MAYRLEWDAGASAEMEVFFPDPRPNSKPDPNFWFKFTPPFRGPYGPGVIDSGFAPEDLDLMFGKTQKDLTGNYEKGSSEAVSGRRALPIGLFE